MKPNFDFAPKPAPASAFAGGKGIGLVDSLKAQQVASAAIPSIRSPAIPTDAQIGPQSLAYQQIIVAGGQKYPFVVKGDYVYVEGLAWDRNAPETQSALFGGTVTIRPDTTQNPIPVTEPFREIRFSQPFNYVEIQNTDNNATVYLTIWAGFGAVRRDRCDQFQIAEGQFSTGAGPAVVVSKNHTLGATGIFYAALPSYSSQGKIIAAKLTRVFDVGVPLDSTLWLFSDYPAAYGLNVPFLFAPPGATSYNSFIGKIDFKNMTTGDVGSLYSVDFETPLSIPVYAKPTSTYYSRMTFPFYGVLVTNANYNYGGLTIWTADLTISYE